MSKTIRDIYIQMLCWEGEVKAIFHNNVKKSFMVSIAVPLNKKGGNYEILTHFYLRY